MKKKQREFNIAKFLIVLFLVLYTVILFVQWGWAILNSLKDYYEFTDNVIGFPLEWRFDNYSYAFKKFYLNCVSGNGRRDIYMEEMYLYTVLYAGGCAFTSTLFPCCVSYVVARYPFKPLKIVYFIVVTCMVIPLVGTLPAQLKVASALGIANHIWGMWIMTGHFLGVYFLVFYATFKTLSMGYTEAARIDGASNFTIMVRVIFPLIRNMFLTIFLLQLVNFWNDYQTALVFIPNKPTISIGLYYMSKSVDPRMSSIPLRLTGCMMVLLPILIVFLIFRDRLMGNLSMGGMKE